MFNLKTKEKLSVRVKGLFPSFIPYEVRVEIGNWSVYFGKYQNQKWAQWDSNDCWCLSAVNDLEDQLEYLHKHNLFSADAIDFYTREGFLDSDGDFSLSEQFLEILGGNKDNGGTAEEAWQLIEKYGIIPRSRLNYTRERALQFGSKALFNADYYNPARITPEFIELGKQFKKYVQIAHQEIGKLWYTPSRMILEAALKQSPLQIGIPVPDDLTQYNQTFVQFDGHRRLQHEVELYGIDAQGRYLVFDQYEPHLKVLSADYYIPSVMQGVVTAIPFTPSPIPQPVTYWSQFWANVWAYFNNRPSPYPNVPVGNRA